jgi:myo-inositol 2-dehydrogenase/D-chiro-inositol 1-dehydrogenase
MYFLLSPNFKTRRLQGYKQRETKKMASPKLKIAIAGLGRMGARHAHHFYALTPRADVIAVSSPMQDELDWAKKELDGVRTYLSFDEMLGKEKDL